MPETVPEMIKDEKENSINDCMAKVPSNLCAIHVKQVQSCQR